MEHDKTALTPENYTRAIISLSKRFSTVSTFPGNNYLNFGEWMLEDRIVRSPRILQCDNALYTSSSERPHDLVVVYNAGEREWDVQQYNQEQHEAFSTSTSDRAEGVGQIVFIRGFISPSWVSVIGSKYTIDPEFFRRHMDFFSMSAERHSFSLPSLANSSNNIFRLCVSTILYRDDFGGQDLQLQRSDKSTELAAYRTEQLWLKGVCCGDSMVREYSTVCSCFSVVEQWISFCVAETDKGWSVIVWMDQGRPLEESPSGPWTSHITSHAIALPVIQHHPKMAFRTTANRLDPDEKASAEIQQNTAILPMQYDSMLELVNLGRRASRDPLSMCIPLFAHAAFSEVQFLNLMESRINIQVNAIVEGDSAEALETLQYFSNVLKRHAQQLKDSSRALSKLAERSNQGSNGVKTEGYASKSATQIGTGTSARRQPLDTESVRGIGSSSSDGSFTLCGLLEDYEQLHVRCIDLSSMCTWGITLAMNKATIDESRKAIEQSGRVKKLTLLATLFIPLSFSASLLGMNIDLLGQNAVKFWWFFVLCIPITIFAYVFYLWDSEYLLQWWGRVWKACRSVMRDKVARRPEKDPSYLV